MPPLFRKLTRTDVADPHLRNVVVPTNDAIPAITIDTRTSDGDGPYFYEDTRTSDDGGPYKRDE